MGECSEGGELLTSERMHASCEDAGARIGPTSERAKVIARDNVNDVARLETTMQPRPFAAIRSEPPQHGESIVVTVFAAHHTHFSVRVINLWSTGVRRSSGGALRSKYRGALLKRAQYDPSLRTLMPHLDERASHA